MGWDGGEGCVDSPQRGSTRAERRIQGSDGPNNHGAGIVGAPMVKTMQKHRQGYCECGRKLHIAFYQRARAASRVQVKAHDLCTRCWRSQQAQSAAGRMKPKPWWLSDRMPTLSTSLGPRNTFVYEGEGTALFG